MAKNRPPLRSAVITLVELGGLVAITGGVALVFVPAALVVGGVGLVLWAQGVGR